ncbi:MAG: sulfur carrier protein ThiS adenylyltransferase ThiF [Marinilabiliaceae bacterium]|nr:sulfur carrier protein ThiS adenylyltransferase ThiF [Marinilabiliaceae bacterium]
MEKGITLSALTAKNIPNSSAKLLKGKVAIAGLGGLGSNIAVMLARIGVGKLLLVDFDKVEPSNLNRQHYNTSHIGMYKTEALKSQIDVINPFIDTETVTVKITEENAAKLFIDYPIVCEAFDNPKYKAILVNALLQSNDTKIVAASGLSGYKSANKITTKRVFKNLYLCGDSEYTSEDEDGLMAPRVSICAGHQANMIVRLLLGMEDV